MKGKHELKKDFETHKTPLFLHTVRLGLGGAGVLAYGERGTPVLFVFCPWNSKEFRARVAAAKLMNILWAKDPGGVQKIMANNEKKDSPLVV